MTTYSFRAECEYDINTFQETLKDYKLSIEIKKADLGEGFGEYSGEFESDLGIEELRNYMRAQDDCHVMVQSLRPIPLAENDLGRDYNVPF